MDNNINTYLIDGLKQGNKEIFDKIFRTYYSDLVNYCYRFVNDDDTAEEIVQNIFTNLWIKHESLSINSSLKSYLYKSVQNQAINYINYLKQKNKYKEYIALSDLGNNVDTSTTSAIEENDIKLYLNETILMMPEKCREVFELKRYEGLKNKEIAEKLNISTKTVEKHITKALSLLKQTMSIYFK